MGQPTKIMIITRGSRGDIQPFIAIGCALQREGYTVMVGSNADNEDFVKDFGLPFRAIFTDIEAAIKSTPGALEAMANGNVFTFMSAVKNCTAKDAPAACQHFIRMIQQFNPDLLVEGTLCTYFSRFAALMCHIPVMRVQLALSTYNRKRMGVGLPTLPCGCHKFLHKVLAGGIYDGCKPFEEAMVKQFGGGIFDLWTKSDVVQSHFAPREPVYVCQSPSWRDALHPSAHANVKFVGACIIPAEAQAGLSFGGTEAMRSIESFLAEGSKPVYCGFGSMTCKSQEHMVVFVSRALMHSGQRGIILSGWAKLSMTALIQATKDMALLAYAAKNILFVDKAPHEWLFPRVACTVHHGGAGTMASALRAGVPTVITPVFLDQWDHSYLVNKLGVGIGFKKQFQKISAEELGTAIKNVLESTEITAKAKRMGETLRKEHGTQNIVNAVQDFWHRWVQSGRYQAKIMEKKRLRDEARQSSHARSFSCFQGCFSFRSKQKQRLLDTPPLKDDDVNPMPNLLNHSIELLADVKGIPLAGSTVGFVCPKHYRQSA